MTSPLLHVYTPYTLVIIFFSSQAGQELCLLLDFVVESIRRIDNNNEIINDQRDYPCTF